MYLHTRLLIGIAVVTLVALCFTLVVALRSIRADVAQETQSSTQLARTLHAIEAAVLRSSSGDSARDAAATEVSQTSPLRHVSVQLLDADDNVVAVSPMVPKQGSRLMRALLPSTTGEALSYPIDFRGIVIARVRVLSNPSAETAEIEQRVFLDLMLLTLTIVAMATSIYMMVRVGLEPVGQIQMALTRLEAGHLDTRLPHFQLQDLSEISQRFNHCAAALQEAAVRRRELARRLIEVEEEERKRLARELHDELGQILTAIKVDAAYIARESARAAPGIESCARGIESMSGSIVEMIRGMLARLRPHGLETVGLRDTVQDLVNSWQTRVVDRFRCTLQFSGPVNTLPPDISMTVYRLIQECLTNAVRYSKARVIAFTLSIEPTPEDRRVTRVVLTMRESEVVPDGTVPQTSGSGLMGMRERVEAHGGQLRMYTGEFGGVSLQAWMPVSAREEEVLSGQSS